MSTSHIIKFTNGRLLKDGNLIPSDLYICSESGRIISSQAAFYSARQTPEQIIDLQGKILSPGFVEVQLNGCHNFDYSVPSPDYADNLRISSQKLLKNGVTSFVPTVTSQLPEVYHSVLPHLGPNKQRRVSNGAESLGAHVEGPFLNPGKNGIHTSSVLREAHTWSDIESCYGTSNVDKIRYITAAPELGDMHSLIPEINSRGMIFSIGHSDATFEQAQVALQMGATMVTHMFNAMRPFGHRDPGIFGLLGQSSASTPSSPQTSRPSTPKIHKSPRSSWSPTSASPHSSRNHSPRSSLSISTTTSDLSCTPPAPFFGLIADGFHLSPPTVKIAYAAHPAGCILVTDAMKLTGCPDGIYDWTNGERMIKSGAQLLLEKNGRIAGSAVGLLECVNNFRRFTGASVPEALACVTATPARMLGADVEAAKGRLEVGMDADLVVLGFEDGNEEDGELVLDQVWKFGQLVR